MWELNLKVLTLSLIGVMNETLDARVRVRVRVGKGRGHEL